MQNRAEALKWFRKAADQGFANAENELGEMYLNGRDIRQDYTEAGHWFTRATQHGSAVAASNLGYMYYMGRVCLGVTRMRLRGSLRRLSRVLPPPSIPWVSCTEMDKG